MSDLISTTPDGMTEMYEIGRTRDNAFIVDLIRDYIQTEGDGGYVNDHVRIYCGYGDLTDQPTPSDLRQAAAFLAEGADALDGGKTIVKQVD
ncbi:hypothetical protein [Gordonia sp. (in: high G+C Gram-positive bacteria)]|uniref:hypothetical protein n=1 Tax=Gordonia sp. (in: high G+C Gram-positive bacteria) TaxID=84139 RepID=UPI003C7962C2